MVNRVVATKLNEEEHTKLVDACSTEGCTPSSFIRDAILKRIEPDPKKKHVKDMSMAELEQALRKS